MNPRYLVTAALMPLAAVALALAPILQATVAEVTKPEKPLQVEEVAPLVQAQGEIPAPSEDGSVHVSVTPDRSVLYTGGDRRMRLRVDLSSAEGQGSALPTDLVVVMDRSGSMRGNKMLDAKAAAAELVSQLGPEDRFGLVSFSDGPRLDLPLAAVNAKTTRAIERLQPDGGTDMLKGLETGLAQAHRTSGRTLRMILISDGLPNERHGLSELAASASRQEVPLSTIGIGLDYDEALMEQLADLGGGNFHWTQRGPELSQVLAGELSTARSTVAQGVAVTLQGTQVRLVEAGGLPVLGQTAQLGTLFAGQHRTLWLTVEVPPVRGGTVELGSFQVSFTTPAGEARAIVAKAGPVQMSGDAQASFASLGDDWAHGLVEEEYNELRTAVSSAVQQGDQLAALEALEAYELRNRTFNAWAQNEIVDNNLAEVQQLKAQVTEQFVGEDQEARQNVWAKGTRKSSYDQRRGMSLPSPMPMSAP